MQSKFATQIREIRTTVRSSGSSILLPGAKTVSRDIQHHGEFMRSSGARAIWDIRDEDKVLSEHTAPGLFVVGGAGHTGLMGGGTAFLGSTHGIGLRPSLDTISILGSNTPVELDPGAPLVVLWQVRPPVAVGICWSLFGQSIAQTRRHSISAIRHPQPDRPPPSTFRPSKPPLQRPSSLFTVSAPVSEPRLGVCMVFSGTFSLIFGLLAKEPAVRAPR
ncbi:hypothetical protein MHUMG1_02721 [Metarhizium humberi]|uniref:Uncharacterized protein n=1 Tax=Metarhizium humberi TaxID=2596975 RepID=A0A9P8MGR7_9HYPO|nr:hypothetical protein MHUMG1_02721 [Metarhizium humberi]